MAYRWIDMERFPRREHFAYFSSLAYPYVGTTANVDITDILQKIKREKLPFFLTVCFCAARAANSVPELRQRIRDGRIVEYDRCRVSHTVALEDGTFCYCTLEDEPDLYAYLDAGRRAQEAAKRQASIEEDPEETLEKFWGDAVELTEGAELTWMRQPHYYMGLYSYTYSAGLTVATQVCRRIEAEGQRAVEDWKRVLAAGGTRTPLELAQMAGVDISTDGPLLDTIETIGGYIDEICRLTEELA